MATYVSSSAGNTDQGTESQSADLYAPAEVDQLVRKTLQLCWRAMSRDRRSIEEHQRQVHRLVERGLRDFREDREEFGRMN
jgi:hypothetical protein